MKLIIGTILFCAAALLGQYVSIGGPVFKTSGGGAGGFSGVETITFDHTKVPNTDQTNFPALIYGTYGYLATIANGGLVTSSSGYDIVYTSDAGCATPLSQELANYTAATGAVEEWVKIPTLSHTADTVIYECYGKSGITTDQSTTATWPSQYKAVYHLNTSSAPDSTGVNNGAVIGTITTVAGQIGSAQNSTGTTANRINTGGMGNIFGSTSVLTISAWLYDNNVSTLADDSPIGSTGSTIGSIPVIFAGTVSVPNTLMFQYTSNGFGGYQTFSSTAFTVPLNTWYHASWSLDLGTTANSKIYANGALQASSVTPTGTPPTTFTGLSAGVVTTLLSGYSSIYAYTGSIDEVRYSNTIPSADWVSTEYNNQSSPATFYTPTP